MADGTIIINTEIDSRQAQKGLNALTRKIAGLSEKLNDLERKKLPLVEQSAQLGANLDVAKATLEHMKSGAEFFTFDSIANQQAQVNAMQREFDSAVLKEEAGNRFEKLGNRIKGLARRSGKRKISRKAKNEQGKYSSKYALTELLVCRECKTPYRRCT